MRRIGVLARLALAAGQPVPADRLLADVWERSSAVTAAKQVHIVVSKLRETFALHGRAEIIQTVARWLPARRRARPRGRPRLHPPVQAGARRPRRRRDSDRGRAVPAGAGALAGPCAGRGVTLHGRRPRPTGWRRSGCPVLEDHAELRLAAGDHRAVACELAAHVRAHPLRERPAAHLMLACVRDARASEALEVYHRLRRSWSRETGHRARRPNCAPPQAVSSRIRCSTGARAVQATPDRRVPRPSCDTRAFTARAARYERLHADL
ncbi:AfsR/SARP family transcriptional regulator [Nonomuraea dietziae]|uniref:AfsR/SARP family transcriptional regulator n=1 Tax=Nonomuraea dietziae TaxID=65515 RepID=UPI0031D9EF0A